MEFFMYSSSFVSRFMSSCKFSMCRVFWFKISSKLPRSWFSWCRSSSISISFCFWASIRLISSSLSASCFWDRSYSWCSRFWYSRLSWWYLSIWMSLSCMSLVVAFFEVKKYFDIYNYLSNYCFILLCFNNNSLV